MKKLSLILLCCLVFSTSAYALTDVQKTKIAAKRQIYSAQRKSLNNQLEATKAEYLKVSANTSMNATAKNKKLQQLENKIVRINQEKDRLKKQYNNDKKAIKRQG